MEMVSVISQNCTYIPAVARLDGILKSILAKRIEWNGSIDMYNGDLVVGGGVGGGGLKPKTNQNITF